MNDIDYELIERYLSGEMTAEATAAFDTRIQTEPDLREAVQRYKEVQDTLRQSLRDDPQREQLKQTLHSHRHEFKEAKRVNFRRYYIGAASVAAVIAVLLYVSPWQQNAAVEFSVAKMVSPTERGSNDTSLQKATENFNHQRYQQAIDDLNKVIANNPDDAFSIYHRGLAYMELNKNDYARGDLELIFNGESIFKYDAAFYIALSYYKEKKYDQCRSWIGKIPADAGKTYDRAQKLLKEVR